MNEPYAIFSDVHLHSWTKFRHVMPDGQNSRLVGLLDELWRCAVTLKAAHGRVMFCAGDLFHVRGSLPPSVMNPTFDMFKRITSELGIQVVMIPGNHDLETEHSTRLSSAVTHLEGAGVTLCYEPQVYQSRASTVPDVLMVPWEKDVAALKRSLQQLVLDTEHPADVDLILHAPVNGVLLGIPDHGLEPDWLADLGFRRVFSGHYHNHVAFCDRKVFSIGALAHLTWSDVGSVAGFLLVNDHEVVHYPSRLPKFIDVHPEMPAAEVADWAVGNYMRVKVSTSKLADIESMREWLTKEGAVGVEIISVKEAVSVRPPGSPTVQSGASIEVSVADYVKSKSFSAAKQQAVHVGALAVLAKAEVA